MKKNIFVIVLIMSIATGAMASQSETRSDDPETKVKASFPEAKNIHKINKAEGYTEFDFRVNHKNVSAIYNKEGQLVETDYEVSYNDLPLIIKKTVEDNFVKLNVKKVCKVSYRENSFYKITIVSEGKQYNIAADNDGEITIVE